MFVFFEIVEFALVLVLKEIHERKLREMRDDRSESECGKVFSNQIERIQTIMTVRQCEEMNRNLDINCGNESRKTRFCINTHRFFEKLPLTRKIDFWAFIIHHFAYVLFNIIYWAKQ